MVKEAALPFVLQQLPACQPQNQESRCSQYTLPSGENQEVELTLNALFSQKTV